MKYLDLYLFYAPGLVGMAKVNNLEMLQHCHMIMSFYHWQQFGFVDLNWMYIPATRNLEIKNMADAFLYNPVLNEYITLQYKYKQYRTISILDLYKLKEAYYQTDLVQVGLANYNIYNEQIFKVGSSSWKNIYFQNYDYLNTEVVDPNVINYIFELYNKQITNEHFLEINKNFLTDLDRHHFKKPEMTSAKKLMLNQILYDNQNPFKLVNSNNLTHIE